MSSSSSGPRRMKLSCLRVSNVNAVQKPSTRTEDPSVFAAASDIDNTSLAVKRGNGIMCSDAVAAIGQAPETDLIFIEAPEEHRAVVGQHVLWQFESERM